MEAFWDRFVVVFAWDLRGSEVVWKNSRERWESWSFVEGRGWKVR